SSYVCSSYLALFILFTVLTVVYTDIFTEKGMILIPVYVVAVALYGALFFLLKGRKEGFSFTVTRLILILVTSSFFIGLFPHVMISSLGDAYNMTVYAAASGAYSLKL